MTPFQSNTLKNFKKINTENVQKITEMLRFLKVILAHFSHFARNIPKGVIIVPKMLERSPINFNFTRPFDSGKTSS